MTHPDTLNIPRAEVEQALEALDLSYALLEMARSFHYPKVLAAYKTLRAAQQPQAAPCIGKDPLCPCPDGDACHYKGVDAWPIPAPAAAEPVLKQYLREQIETDMKPFEDALVAAEPELPSTREQLLDEYRSGLDSPPGADDDADE